MGRDAVSYASAERPIQTGCCSIIIDFSFHLRRLFLLIFFFFFCWLNCWLETTIRCSILPSNSGDCWTREMMGDTSAGGSSCPVLLLWQSEEEWLSQIHQSTNPPNYKSCHHLSSNNNITVTKWLWRVREGRRAQLLFLLSWKIHTGPNFGFDSSYT